MSNHTAIRSRTAIGLALALSALTCWVTLSDVTSITDLTPAHALTLAAVPLAIYAGHSALPVLFAGRIFVGLGLLALAIGATAYLSAVSGIRNTAAVEAKGKRIAEANAARIRAGNDVKAARAMHTDAKAEETAECKKVGPQCERKTARTAAAWSHVLLTEATSKQLGAIEDPMAGYRALAELASLAPGITAERSTIERGLVLALPWLAVVLCELGAVVCFSAGLGARTAAQSAPAATHAQADIVQTPFAHCPNRPDTLSAPLSAGALTLRRILEQAGKPLTVTEAARAMSVEPSEASKRWRELPDIVAKRSGRNLLLSLAETPPAGSAALH